MGAEPIHDWQKIVASTLDWWQDAGVDMLVGDEARDWLARPASRDEAATVPAAVAAPVAELLPDTLDAFVTWRLGPEAPEAGWMTPRIAPAGPAEPDWVVLTDMPEADDSEVLLTGPAGRLLDRMLEAAGLSRESVYLTSVATARPLAGRIPPEQTDRLNLLTRHHLSLLKPRRLLLLGQAASRVLSETKDAGVDNRLHHVNHFGRECAAVASFPPRFLLERPAAKSEAWKHLLLLSRGLSE